MLAGERNHALKEPVGPHVSLLNGSLGPAESPGTDVLSFSQQVGLICLLTGRLVGGAMLIQRIEGAGGSSCVNADTLSLVIDPDQALIPVDPYLLTQQPVRYRVEGSAHLHVAIQMDRAGTHLKETEALCRHGLKRRFLYLQEVGIHLLACPPMDAYPGHGAVPALKEAVQFLQAVEPPSFEGIILEVATAALDDTLLLGMAWSARKRNKTPVMGKGSVKLVDVGVIETGPGNTCLEVIQTYGMRYSA
jgi:hypothetical protein